MGPPFRASHDWRLGDTFLVLYRVNRIAKTLKNRYTGCMKDVITNQEILKRIEDRHRIIITTFNECPEIIFVETQNSILRKKTEDVSVEVGIKTGNKLKDILGKYRKIAGYGRGLAAPQIGISQSVFVTYVDDSFKIYINPKIMEFSADFNYYREICLSCAYTVADVKRSKSITIKYANENGKIISEKADGFLARLLQHEYDHLQGILNIDAAEKGGLSDSLYIDPLKEQLRDC